MIHVRTVRDTYRKIRSDFKESPGTSIVGLIFVVGGFIPLALFLWAYATWLNWGWFVVPLGFEPITMWHAAGLALLANFVTGRERGAMVEQDPAWWDTMVVPITRPLLCIALGWILLQLS